jgi:phenylalanyl-tRNA synthetase beta chain
LKAQVGNIFRKLGIPVEQLQEEAMTGKNDLFSQGLTYRKGEMILAELYDVAPNWIREFELKNAVYFALIRWESMMKFRGDHRVMHHELPRFPEVKRDLALLIDKSVSYDQVRELAYKTEGRLLKRVSLFDVYEGDRIESNKKSYAVSFILQDPDATLTDDRIDRIMNRLMDVYRRELHAEIR